MKAKSNRAPFSPRRFIVSDTAIRDERANFRSATPRGFALACFDANRPDRHMKAAA